VTLGEDTGHRVYYKDEKNRTSSLRYTDDWYYDGFISQDDDLAVSVAAAFMTPSNVTIVMTCTNTSTVRFEEAYTRIDGRVWVLGKLPGFLVLSVFPPIDSWSETHPQRFGTSGGYSYNTTDPEDSEVTSTVPSPTWSLEAYDGAQATLNLAFDRNERAHLFYIGIDRSLHHVRRTQQGYKNMATGHASHSVVSSLEYYFMLRLFTPISVLIDKGGFVAV
jgi:hypothetical protein